MQLVGQKILSYENMPNTFVRRHVEHSGNDLKRRHEEALVQAPNSFSSVKKEIELLNKIY